jgi:hypothetical protein
VKKFNKNKAAAINRKIAVIALSLTCSDEEQKVSVSLSSKLQQTFHVCTTVQHSPPQVQERFFMNQVTTRLVINAKKKSILDGI